MMEIAEAGKRPAPPASVIDAETATPIASRWSRLGYAMGTSGMTIGATPTNLFLLYYLTEIAGLRAGLAGIAIAIPKIWDAIVDPMFGGWIDRCAIRMG